MKKTLVSILVALLAGSAHAGAFGGYGGRLSTADFGDATTVGAKLEASLIDVLGLELRGGYTYDFEDETLALDDFAMYSAEAGLLLRMPFGDYFSLHVGAGGGYYVLPEFDMTLSDGTVRTSDIDDSPGGYGLVGAELGSPNFRIFVEAKYLLLQPETVKAEFIPGRYLEIDTDLSGVALQGGVVVRW